MRGMGVAVAVVSVTLSSFGAAEETPLEPAMILVEGGSYPIGSPDAPSSARPAHQVTLEFELGSVDDPVQHRVCLN